MRAPVYDGPHQGRAPLEKGTTIGHRELVEVGDAFVEVEAGTFGAREKSWTKVVLHP